MALANSNPIDCVASALVLMARETRVSRGAVPAGLNGVPLGEESWILDGEQLLLRGEHGIRLWYRKGMGVTLEAPDDTDPRDVDLWLNGTVYAAVAAINGLLPIHASAVAHAGRVHAFSGPPGEGKSTLAAGLGQLGFPLFCDDTLILDVSSPEEIVCLPGHKRLKLWPEGVALSGARAREQVASGYPKNFAEPAGGVVTHPLPLAELVFLEPGEAPAMLPVAGGQRLARLQDDHYTAKVFECAGRRPRNERFAQLAAVAARMPMHRFVRPFSAERFGEGLAFMADHIRSGS